MNRIVFAFFMLFLVACSKLESFEQGDTVTTESPIEIAVITPSQTKGSLVIEPKDMGSVGLYCAMTGSDKWSTTTKFSKLKNQRFYISGDSNWLIDGEPEPWGFEALNDKYTFFAYSPYSKDTQGVTPDIVDGELVIDYTVPANSIDQPDLMYAIPRKDIFAQVAGSVSLTFCHTLCSVSFGVIASTDTKINAIDITGVISSGVLRWNYSDNIPQWSLGDLSDDTLSVEVGKYTLDDDNSAQLNTDSSYLMMIPQQLTLGAKVILTLSNGKQKTLKIPSGSEWKAGEIYNYVIRLDDVDCDFLFTSSQLSNCYIINPTVNEQTVVQIPIEDRINDFWKNYSSYGRNRIKKADSTDKFIVRVLWEDFDDLLQFSYEILDDADENMAVRLTIPANFQKGNMVFAVEEDSDAEVNDILWSWHLWFTDYNPDEIANANLSKIEQGVDKEYKLSGYTGAVHRYADAANIADSAAVWRGIYKDKFIMDRNIGARDEYAINFGAGSVYYEFGRKDPFPGNGAKYSSGATQPSIRSYSSFSFDESVDFAYDYFVSGSGSSDNWSDETAARVALYIWYDENILSSGYSEGKSIFDPSPLGWRIPVSDTWSSFNFSQKCQLDSTSVTSVGKYYYYGYRTPNKYNNFVEDKENGYVWSANQFDSDSAYCFSYSVSEASSPTKMALTYGFPVRAIQE